jgi:hypothetical protein
MMVVSDTNSIGRPNLAFASGGEDGGPNDLLMRFSTPVRYVKVVTDATAEKPDRVRLLALEATGVANQFVVRAIGVGIDDAPPPLDSVLAVSTRRPFSFALFQATTEREGIDSLRFETTCGHAPDEHAEPLRPLLRVFPDEQGAGEWRWRPVP